MSGFESYIYSIPLGMSTVKKGSMDPATSKMLCLHIPYLLPPPFADITGFIYFEYLYCKLTIGNILVPSVVQTAALAGCRL